MQQNHMSLSNMIKEVKEVFFHVPALLIPTRYREIYREIDRAPKLLEQSFYTIFIKVWNITEKVTVTDVFYYSSVEDPLGLQSPRHSRWAQNTDEEQRKQARIIIQSVYKPNSFIRITSNKFTRVLITSLFVLTYFQSNGVFQSFPYFESQINGFLFKKMNNINQLEINSTNTCIIKITDLLTHQKSKELLGNSLPTNSILRWKMHSKISDIKTIFNMPEKWIYLPLGLGLENSEQIFSYRNFDICNLTKNSSNIMKIKNNRTILDPKIDKYPLVLKNKENILFFHKLPIQFFLFPYIVLRIWLAPVFVLWWSYQFNSEEKENIKNNLKNIHDIEISTIQKFVAKAITFRDIGGMESLKQELATVAFLLKQKNYSNSYPMGYLFAGPPGTGKTLMAKAMSYEAETPYLYVEGSQFRCREEGVANARVDDLFKQIQNISPCILYIDEIDSIAERREEANKQLEQLKTIGDSIEGSNINIDQKPSDTVLMQFLIYMDGYKKRNDLIIIGATNRIETLDDAIMRPGRFDRQIVFSPPFFEERKDILRIFLRNTKALVDDTTKTMMAERSIGLNGCDLRLLADNILLLSALESRNQQKTIPVINEDTFDRALERVSRIRHIISNYELAFGKYDFYRTAYHEAGIALIHTLLPECRPVYSVKLFPKPLNDRYLEIERENLKVPSSDIISTNNIDYFVQKIVGLLAGRAAESILFDFYPGQISTYLNKTYDPNIQGAYNIAHHIVEFGLLDSVTGVIHYLNSENENNIKDPFVTKINDLIQNKVTLKTNRELRKYSQAASILDFNEFWYEQDYPWQFDFIKKQYIYSNESSRNLDMEIVSILHTLFQYTYDFLKSNEQLLDHLASLVLKNKSISQKEIHLVVNSYGIKIPTKTWKAW
uniref:Protein Ycf2 n=1 Tax=Mesostigma viride TaxID=41882 RepID=YCF2_MESVI|nr:cell division protein [Mesostigma viride]Q9MUP8.1 RecName: Full=Protein Ycf2; Short=RF2 [Mesostigma viride]AAF43852.1 hypothetical chloroplast RF2 [Mesostigma viride]WKT08197.1 ATP-dependent metalloprotease [Mesostigma viride]|eukprot:jgi/Mesvir1/25883/Mv26339-RA.1